MTDENPIKSFKENDCELRLVGDPVEFMVFIIPIKKYANDLVDGQALVYGKFREAQAHAMAQINLLRQRKKSFGVINPNGKQVI